MVLANFLQDHQQGFAKTIRTWPPSLYNIQHVTVAVEDELKRNPNNPILLDALAELFAFLLAFSYLPILP